MKGDVNNVKTNCTTVFLIPMVIQNRDMAKKLGFVNGYVKDVDRPDLDEEGTIFALFKPEDLKDFKAFSDAESDNIIEDYDYEGGYIVMVYKLPEEYLKDYKKIMKGQYSKVSQKFKDNFPKIRKVMIDGKDQDSISLGYMVLTQISSAEFAKMRKIPFSDLSDVPLIKEYWEETLEMPIPDKQEYWDTPEIAKETLNIEEIKKVVDE